MCLLHRVMPYYIIAYYIILLDITCCYGFVALLLYYIMLYYIILGPAARAFAEGVGEGLGARVAAGPRPPRVPQDGAAQVGPAEPLWGALVRLGRR